MAVTNGSIKSKHSIGRVDEGWGIRVDWEQLDNSYNIKATVYFEFRQTWSNLRITNDRTGTLTVDGVVKSFTMSAGNYPAGKRNLKLGEYTFSIGSAKTINISVSFPIAWTLRGYWVTNFNASGKATLKSIMSRPNNPTNVNLSLSGTTLNLSWNHTATQDKPVSRFNIQISENGGSWESEGTTTNKSYSRTGTRGRSYKFRVRAENAAGNSDYASSNEVRIPYLTPNNPTNVNLSLSGTTLNLSWSHTATQDRPVSRFSIQIRENGGSWQSVGTTTNKSYSRTGTRGRSYQFRVRAENADGSSSYVSSNEIRIPYLAPNAPTNVNLSLSGTTLNLSWNHTATQDRPVSRFSIQISENGGSWQSVGTTTNKSYSRTGTRGRSYKFRVRAENADANSGYVSSSEVRIPYLAPNAPTNVKVTRQSHTRFTVTWDISVTSDRPVSSFEVYRSVNGGSYTRIASGLSSSARSYNDDTVELGKTYSYYIKAINQDGSTDSSRTSGLINPTGIPVYSGSSFVIRPVYVYDGSQWVHRPVYVYNGSQWVWRG